MSGSEHDSEGQDDWEDWESEGAGPSGTELAQSLFSSTVLPSIDAALQFDEENFGFNFAAYRKQVRSPSSTCGALRRLCSASMSHSKCSIASILNDVSYSRRGWMIMTQSNA